MTFLWGLAYVLARIAVLLAVAIILCAPAIYERVGCVRTASKTSLLIPHPAGG